MEFRQLTGPVLDADVDLLAFSVSGDPAKDALFKQVDQALEGT